MAQNYTANYVKTETMLDAANRLTSGTYSEGNALTSNFGRYSEQVNYDDNGNITSIIRNGKTVSGYGAMDNLTITYDGNQLASVSESVADNNTNGTFEYKKANGSGYIYNANGSLVADKSRGIAYITYDWNNNPKQIYFTNGSVTKYVYSASGKKLRAVHYTAKPNITRTWGVKPAELTSSQILQADSTDYLLGGSLTLKNGKVDKYLFEGGYAQETPTSSTTDSFAFYYYNQDHLGNIREVVNASGAVKQVTNYYPFGAPYADTSAAINPDFQPYKYNGKELDKMHGLNTYDYGARQYDPILARWGRIDPLAENFYKITPYNYCMDNPCNTTDPDGKGPILGAIIGATVELGTQFIENYDMDLSIMDNLSQNVNWTNVAIAAGEGALTSGASALKGIGAKVAVSAVSSAVKEVSDQVKGGAKSYKDIDYKEVGKKAITSAAISGGAGLKSKQMTDFKFKNTKATPPNAIKHKRAGQKRYSRSAQQRANKKLQKQKDNYNEKVDNYWKNSANIINSFIERFSK
ncbi:RHS repeat domain-containing protein [Prevotella sp. P6B1]|uniref:RHS repeat domain-containing protein n=1 Tax=Prevotella sp. P6B1 TaxID=1410613 RepID=UPI00069052F7|nr:RHS repeat-associated core domain-containing protein [Prevotella sp. P6B1]